MVRQLRILHALKKGEAIKDEEAGRVFRYVVVWNNPSSYMKRSKPKLIPFLIIFSLLSFCFIFAPEILCFSSSSSSLHLLGSYVKESESLDTNLPKSSTVSNESLWCDRSGHRSDICFMKGDIRTQSSSSSIILYTSQNQSSDPVSYEKIRPYTRKWEASVMNTIDELKLQKKYIKAGNEHVCDVHHDVPAVVFSTGGYTGNVYHEFNDGILPLYITSQRFAKRVVFVIDEYHDWWEMKYGDVVSQLSDFPIVDFRSDGRTHCFKEAIVGLRIHDELAVDPSLMEDNKTIMDFRNLLDRAYRPRIDELAREEKGKNGRIKRPRLAILSRNGSRGITNEESLTKLAKRIGFEVEILRPDKTTEMAKIYQVVNSSDVVVGVHGAAMTHLLFMRPGRVFVQIVPLGTDWAAETYYGEPAKKLGLKYVGYKILPRESSLYGKYEEDDPVLQDPDSITEKGWEFTKRIYLDDQQVTLELKRFKKVLLDAYATLAS